MRLHILMLKISQGDAAARVYRENMKKLVKSSIAIALSGILLCSGLSACFLQNMTDSCTGRVTPSPIHTAVMVDTPAPSETPQAATDLPATETETPAPTDAAETPQNATDVPDNSATPDATAEHTPTQPPAQTPGPSEPTPVPTDTPVPATPDQSGTVALGTRDMPSRFTMPTDLYGLSEQVVEAWFADAVFVGDSITIGWKNYNNLMLESDPSFFGQTRFLCEGSYGVGHALEPISDTSMHPMYGGEQHYIWDAVRMMGAKKVFILFGMNDLTIYGVDGAAQRYAQVIDNINTAVPGVQSYIISAMYMYRGSEREVLNNSNLYLFNQKLVELCASKGCEFINIASHLIDEDGFLIEEYCSDQYVHQTYKAYEIWARILRSVAARHLKGLPPVVFSLPK